LKEVIKFFNGALPLAGKKVLVNAGPTYEAIDPVRFIGNRSSGKMGIAIAEEFAKNGAEVTLVLGPAALLPAIKSIKVLPVESSQQMYEACMAIFDASHIVVCSAAVADYKPAQVSESKIKKSDNKLALDLTKTVDILAEMGKRKNKQCLVGFALETDNLVEYATKKLKEKNLELIVANEVSGLGSDSNRVTIIDKHNKISKFELKSKREAAADIVSCIIKFLK
jgi:phosphopantothenoylcysteine decarboxylase / phosphopantothenate---cysteine ligase